MIMLNGVEYEYRAGLTLGELVAEYNIGHANVEFSDCIVIIDGAAIPAEQAPGWRLAENSTVFIVPKLDGG